MYVLVILAGTAITLASLAGVIFSWRVFGDWIEAHLRYLIALAAGVFVVAIIHLGFDAYVEGGGVSALAAFAIGALFIAFITKLIPDTHHHHGPHPEHHHGRIDARRVLIGDAVHNIHDGIVLVPAFLVSAPVGFATAGAILLHEVVQEISQFFVLREAGYSPAQALLRNLLAQMTLWVGIAISLTLTAVHGLEVPLVAFAAGGFTYILFRDLVPSVLHRASIDQGYGWYALMFTIGLALMTAVSFAAPEEHAASEQMPLPQGFGLG